MKRLNLIAFASAAILSAASCDHSAITPENGEGSMKISFNIPSATTKAATTGNEADLNDISMLIFDDGGSLYRYHEFTVQEISSKTVTINNVKCGSYSIYIVANGPELSGIRSLSEFNSTDIPLSEYNGPDSDFVMEGHSGSVTVTDGKTAEPVIGISRYVSRVAVKTIKNGLPEALGTLQVERVFLSNVVNTQNLSGNKAPGNTAANWYNKEGRADETARNASHIINGSTYTASAPALTYSGIGQTIENGSTLTVGKYLYAYPNTSTVSPDGFSSTFSAQQSVLVIAATFNGKTYYYPVILTDAPSRNTSYEVTAVITGAGSDDPNLPVSSGAIKATVTVTNWNDGKAYTESF